MSDTTSNYLDMIARLQEKRSDLTKGKAKVFPQTAIYTPEGLFDAIANSIENECKKSSANPIPLLLNVHHIVRTGDFSTVTQDNPLWHFTRKNHTTAEGVPYLGDENYKSTIMKCLKQLLSEAGVDFLKMKTCSDLLDRAVREVKQYETDLVNKAQEQKIPTGAEDVMGTLAWTKHHCRNTIQGIVNGLNFVNQRLQTGQIDAGEVPEEVESIWKKAPVDSNAQMFRKKIHNDCKKIVFKILGINQEGPAHGR